MTTEFPGTDRCPTCGQPTQTAERRTRDAIREALFESGITQAELANRVGVTQKHLSQVLNGKSGLSFDLAEKLLGELGQRLETSVAPATSGGQTKENDQ